MKEEEEAQRKFAERQKQRELKENSDATDTKESDLASGHGVDSNNHGHKNEKKSRVEYELEDAEL
jgi:hypothetical protein